MKSGNLNFLEPSGPLQAGNGTALPFFCLQISTVPKHMKDTQLVCPPELDPLVYAATWWRNYRCADILLNQHVHDTSHSVDRWHDVPAIGTCTYNIINKSFSKHMLPCEIEVNYTESLCKTWLCSDRTCQWIAQELLYLCNTHTCMHVHVYTRAHTHTHTHTYMNTHLCIHMWAHMHT